MLRRGPTFLLKGRSRSRSTLLQSECWAKTVPRFVLVHQPWTHRAGLGFDLLSESKLNRCESSSPCSRTRALPASVIAFFSLRDTLRHEDDYAVPGQRIKKGWTSQRLIVAFSFLILGRVSGETRKLHDAARVALPMCHLRLVSSALGALELV